MGDKTQLANFCLSAKSKCWLSVFLASVLAFSIVTLVTVFLGNIVSKFLPQQYIKYGAGFLFIGVGILIFLGKI
ncbi:MAG: TMEM165/GDT1 family protein [Candidatus Omnitrophica bacterium]|nr:TMEM165/GDT1 family protein [Candidatus Omnitrophota bacterium]